MLAARHIRLPEGVPATASSRLAPARSGLPAAHHANVHIITSCPSAQADIALRLFCPDGDEARPVDSLTAHQQQAKAAFEQSALLQQHVRGLGAAHAHALTEVLAHWCCQPQVLQAAATQLGWPERLWIVTFALESQPLLLRLYNAMLAGRAAHLTAQLRELAQGAVVGGEPDTLPVGSAMAAAASALLQKCRVPCERAFAEHTDWGRATQGWPASASSTQISASRIEESDGVSGGCTCRWQGVAQVLGRNCPTHQGFVSTKPAARQAAQLRALADAASQVGDSKTGARPGLRKRSDTAELQHSAALQLHWLRLAARQPGSCARLEVAWLEKCAGTADIARRQHAKHAARLKAARGAAVQAHPQQSGRPSDGQAQPAGSQSAGPGLGAGGKVPHDCSAIGASATLAPARRTCFCAICGIANCMRHSRPARSDAQPLCTPWGARREPHAAIGCSLDGLVPRQPCGPECCMHCERPDGGLDDTSAHR